MSEEKQLNFAEMMKLGRRPQGRLDSNMGLRKITNYYISWCSRGHRMTYI